MTLTKEQLLSGIREEIIKVVPGIMDLKFGCELKGTQHRYPTRGTWYGPYLWGGGANLPVIYCKGGPVALNDDYEIIGRTIQLSDILIVIEKVTNNGMSKYSVDTLGHFKDVTNESYCWTPDGMTPILWNLPNDDLNLQDLPCLQFLYKILKKV